MPPPTDPVGYAAGCAAPEDMAGISSNWLIVSVMTVSCKTVHMFITQKSSKEMKCTINVKAAKEEEEATKLPQMDITYTPRTVCVCHNISNFSHTCAGRNLRESCLW